MANVVGGTVVWNLDVDSSKFDRKLSSASAKTKDFGTSASNTISKTTGIIGKNLNAAGAIAASIGVALKLAGGAAIKSAGSFEQTRISMEGLLGSADAAKRMLSDLSKFAATTPFEFGNISQLSKQLLGVGFAGGDIIPTLTKLGDVAAALGVGTENISSAVRAIGQIRGKGKAQAEELNQLSEALVGFNARSILTTGLAADLGISVEKAGDMVQNGAVPAEKAISILLAGMEKFPGAAGAMARQSKTLNGLFSTLADVSSNAIRTAVGIDMEGNVKTGSIFDLLRNSIANLIPYIEKMAPKISDMFLAFTSNKDVIAAAVGAIGGLLVVAIAAAVVSIGWIPVAIVAAGAAIGALVGVIVSSWGSIKDFFVKTWSVITGAFSTSIDLIVSGINWLKDNWVSAFGYMVGYFLTLPAKMGAASWEMATKIWEAITSIDFSAIGNRLSEAFKSAFNAVVSAGKNAWEKLSSINWGELFSGIGRGIGNTVINLIEGAIKGAAKGIPGLDGLVSKLNIPRFAGGISNFAGGLAVVGERGPELVNLPRGSDVIPNGQIGNISRHGATITNYITMDRLTDIDALNRRMSFQAAVL